MIDPEKALYWDRPHLAIASGVQATPTEVALQEDELGGRSIAAADLLAALLELPGDLSQKRVFVSTNAERNPWVKSQTVASELFLADQRIVVKPADHLTFFDEKPVKLPHKEFTLLSFFAAHPDMLFRRSDLHRNVWGNDWLGDSRTIDVHVRRMRDRAGSELGHPQQGFIETIRSVGYRALSTLKKD